MIDIGIDELYELASVAKSDPYGHPYEQVLDNFGNFRCLMTPSLIMWLIESLREAEKDAERYRWLRNCTTVESKKFVSDSGGWIVGLGVLDGMIDQAMKEKGDE